MKPTISLCIPTFNRAPLLREALERIGEQWAEDPQCSLELIVSDNASTDDTPQVLQEFAAKYTCFSLRVYRACTNQGPDANIYQAIKMAQGTFVYILSDDDILLPGALKKLFCLIHRHSTLDGFCLNIKSFIHSPEEPTPVWFVLEEDTIITNCNNALELLRPAFLSVIAFRRTLVADFDYSDKIGTNLLQSYLFLDVMAHNQGLYVTAQPFLAQRRDNTSGWNYYRVMATGLSDWLAQAEKMGFSRSVVSRILGDHLRGNVFSSTLSFKLAGSGAGLAPSYANYFDGIQRLLKVYGPNPFLLLLVIPLMLTPGFLLRGLRSFYKMLTTRYKYKK